MQQSLHGLGDASAEGAALNLMQKGFKTLGGERLRADVQIRQLAFTRVGPWQSDCSKRVFPGARPRRSFRAMPSEPEFGTTS